MKNRELISGVIRESVAIKAKILEDTSLLSTVEKVAGLISGVFRGDKKVLLCGNGGSAADAQHIAAEFTGRFYFDRPPLFAEALHVNSSYMTAVANDYSYEEVFSRILSAKGRAGDLLIGFSTSGNSVNVVRALARANEIGMISVGFTGEVGGKVEEESTYTIKIPSKQTPRIQEGHILMGHIICEIVEREIFGEMAPDKRP